MKENMIAHLLQIRGHSKFQRCLSAYSWKRRDILLIDGIGPLILHYLTHSEIIEMQRVCKIVYNKVVPHVFHILKSGAIGMPGNEQSTAISIHG